ncbi:MAG: ATP-binding protein [Cytophagaceae bacterium]|jgi:hypothetical protein|nr:ATP-binding protein [Cytophagaceae bacterium]
MILESILLDVIENQTTIIKQKKAGIKRGQLKDTRVIHNFAIVICGVRRCGKSTWMYQLLQQDAANFLFLNFEDPRLVGFDLQDSQRLLRIIQSKEVKTLYFDEIQDFTEWEIFVRQLLDLEYQVVITGSNASLLSTELGSKLTGRHLSYELFPFDYSEFLLLTGKDHNQESIDFYIKNGGFPEFLKTNNSMILNQLLDDIIYRDIAVRYGVRDVLSLRKLAVYLLSNIGKSFSANKLKELFGIKATSTILEYLSHLENTYIVQYLPKFDYSLQVQIRNPKKVYAIDLGLFSYNSVVFTEEHGRRLENLVYLHYRKKFKELYYYQSKKECDFVVFDNGKVKEVIQVCYQLDDINLKRETEGLIEAMDFFKLSTGKIITYNQTDRYVISGKEIEIMTIQELLLQN